MGKKVLDLAKEYNLDKKDLLDHCREIGIFVSSHLSQLTDEEVERIRATISRVKERVELIEKRVKPTIILRRAKESKQKEEPVRPPEIQMEKPLEAIPQSEEEFPANVQDQAQIEPKTEEICEAIQSIPEVTPEEIPAPVSEPIQEVVEAPAPSVYPEREEEVKKVDVLKKEKIKRRTRGKKKKLEPAKIIEKPAIKPVIELEPEPIQTPEIVPSIPEVTEEKEKPRKKKAKKEYEIITERRLGRGRPILRKKEIIQIREELDEKDRFIPPPMRKKIVRKDITLKKPEITVPKPIKRKIKVYESIVVGDLARRMGVKASEVQKKLISLGIMANINQSIDIDAASLVASDFGYEVEKVSLPAEEILQSVDKDVEDRLEPRPPVVTVMGHVDHGKTSLLDAIRETNLTDQEIGGITQHIGAYVVNLDGRSIVFLDTPGHEAFTAMRARGAKVTDIVVLVVAADDGVMNQTKEAIDHARAAGVPIIVAVNKIDKPDARPERVRKELSELGLVPEEWGGDVMFCDISAKKRLGIRELLDSILLQAEMLELRSNPYKKAKGTIIEAKLDKGRGPVATVLIQEGTLRINDPFISGAFSGKVRALIDDKGNKIDKAGPSTPVEVIGFSGVPQAGETFIALSDEKDAREIEEYIRAKQREREIAQTGKISLERLYNQVVSEGPKEFNVIIKGDVQGSIEAVINSLQKISGERVNVKIIHSSVGGITENDVMLASASNAIIIGFNVRPEARASVVAENEGVDIRLYNIIYDLIDDIQKAMLGLLEPRRKERVIGRGKVIQIFRVPKVGQVAGTSVTDGKIVRGAMVRIIRESKVIYQGKIASLKRFQDDVKEVSAGLECGVNIENYNDIKVNDELEVFEYEEISPEL
jgi:translation initiation factor IF-2